MTETSANPTIDGIKDAYGKATRTQQSQMRVCSAIGLIMNSKQTDATKADALLLTLSAYRNDTITQAMESLAAGALKGHDIGLGVIIFGEASAKCAKADTEKLITLLETLFVPERADGEKAGA